MDNTTIILLSLSNVCCLCCIISLHYKKSLSRLKGMIFFPLLKAFLGWKVWSSFCFWTLLPNSPSVGRLPLNRLLHDVSERPSSWVLRLSWSLSSWLGMSSRQVAGAEEGPGWAFSKQKFIQLTFSWSPFLDMVSKGPTWPLPWYCVSTSWSIFFFSSGPI